MKWDVAHFRERNIDLKCACEFSKGWALSKHLITASNRLAILEMFLTESMMDLLDTHIFGSRENLIQADTQSKPDLLDVWGFFPPWFRASAEFLQISRREIWCSNFWRSEFLEYLNWIPDWPWTFLESSLRSRTLENLKFNISHPKGLSKGLAGSLFQLSTFWRVNSLLNFWFLPTSQPWYRVQTPLVPC